jgi:hypothetical protein
MCRLHFCDPSLQLLERSLTQSCGARLLSLFSFARSADHSVRNRKSNKNHAYALTVMPKNDPPTDKPGPMGMQPIEHGPVASTQMLPLMPSTKGETEEEASPSAPEKKQRTRAEAVRAVWARITRRNSLRKQRDAQKG